MRAAILRTSLLLTLASPLAAQARDCDGYFTPLVVPAGFCVRVWARQAGAVRHLVVHPSGWVVAALNTAPGLVRFRDAKDTGTADQAIPFGPGDAGTGVAWGGGWLYFASDGALYRYRWPANRDAPDSEPEVIAKNLPVSGAGWAHNMKGLALSRDGTVYLSYGSRTDNCQAGEEGPHPGLWPCPELNERAGVWSFTPPTAPGKAWTVARVATGLRNAESIAIDTITEHIWAATHGRDFLNHMWGWPDSISANQPAEMLEQIVPQADYGWPYCMGEWTTTHSTLIRAPEYSQRAEVDCSLKTQPILGFPGHWAPMAIALSNAAVPEPYTHGLLIAFHGSRSRAPLPEDGHYLIFVPFDSHGRPTSDTRIMLRSNEPPGALRLAGVTVTPDGMIYVADDDHGVVFRIEPHVPKVRN
ncbi:MAG TPA: PQQ-dependent sugar dehydrogenase [Gemmatimonadales bacterium]|jgi:glucose/arabinose dehydrogenase|nr:PQQ-dependent sugar dehydrogenase [Gemmatimonadales bacterium]